MKILVYGGGVLGSLYAARLQQSGSDVTLLARGQRLLDVREHGILLVDDETGIQTSTPIQVIDHLDTKDEFDWAIVAVRKNQLATVLPDLAANQFIPNILFLVNNAAGPQEMIDALGAERVVLGFPGASGRREGPIIHYISAGSVQPTTLGELDGRVTLRLAMLGSRLRAAGFKVAYSSNMDAWLKTHAVIVTPIALGIYAADGDISRLAHTRDALLLTLRAVREGLRTLHALNLPIVPARYMFFDWLPEPLLAAVLSRGFATEKARLALASHANAARDEMTQLTSEVKDLTRAAGVKTPALDRLSEFIQAETPELPLGSKTLPLHFGGTLALLITLTSLAVVTARFRWLRTRRQKKDELS